MTRRNRRRQRKKSACSTTFIIRYLSYVGLYECRRMCQREFCSICRGGYLSRVISTEPEDALRASLEKGRSKQPQTPRDLARMLARCADVAIGQLTNATAGVAEVVRLRRESAINLRILTNPATCHFLSRPEYRLSIIHPGVHPGRCRTSARLHFSTRVLSGQPCHFV